MSSTPDVKAVALNEDISSEDAWQRWQARQNRPIGHLAQIPEAWRDHLMSRGVITRVLGDTLLLLSTRSETVPCQFPLRRGSMVFLAPHTA